MRNTTVRRMHNLTYGMRHTARGSSLFSAVVAALFAAAAIAPEVAQAQAANPAVGKWTIEYERGRRVENDEVTPILGKGTLTVEAQGDSAVVTLEPSPRPDGTPSPRLSFGGTWQDGALVFVQKQRVQVQLNGESSTPEVTITWTLKATGDVLTGTLSREFPAMPEPVAQTPVNGTRLKS